MNVADFATTAGAALGSVVGRAFQWDGRLQARNTNTPNVWSGNGVPSATTISGQVRKGDFYFNNAAAGGVTNIYVCTTGGAPGTWSAIA